MARGPRRLLAPAVEPRRPERQAASVDSEATPVPELNTNHAFRLSAAEQAAAMAMWAVLWRWQRWPPLVPRAAPAKIWRRPT